ncbi:LapA family protein [Brachybacterium muris]|uniref:LapA family protein n=1 Tax=Brachybacterium muris TaxID=219301 RepID=UPI00223ABCFC|nr:LapA family protein [Brachybacterium muris]MCT1654863.1 LapA family protein [Brachybacterium muris]
MSTGPEQHGRENLDRPVTREPLGPDGGRDLRDRGPAPDDRRAGESRVDERRADGRRTEPAPAPAREQHDPAVEPEPRSGGKTAAIWISLILGAIILILLLIFVIQNNVTATFQYFNAQFDLPLGVAMLLAAIAGALVMALVGSMRMIQMGWSIRKLRRQQEKIQRAVR